MRKIFFLISIILLNACAIKKEKNITSTIIAFSEKYQYQRNEIDPYNSKMFLYNKIVIKSTNEDFILTNIISIIDLYENKYKKKYTFSKYITGLLNENLLINIKELDPIANPIIFKLSSYIIKEYKSIGLLNFKKKYLITKNNFKILCLNKDIKYDKNNFLTILYIMNKNNYFILPPSDFISAKDIDYNK